VCGTQWLQRLGDHPCGTYLLQQKEGDLLLLRITGDEPSDAALAPAALWPLLLTEG
jgi:hypothetical protein